MDAQMYQKMVQTRTSITNMIKGATFLSTVYGTAATSILLSDDFGPGPVIILLLITIMWLGLISGMVGIADTRIRNYGSLHTHAEEDEPIPLADQQKKEQAARAAKAQQRKQS